MLFPSVDAETLNCPMCGAAASTDSTHCEHCGSRLAKVACPKCFGWMFVGAKFCSHCGAEASRTELPSAPRHCPRCKVILQAVEIGGVELGECPRCVGLWVDIESLRRICADHEKQSAVMGAATLQPLPAEVELESKIRYVPCPVCHALMNRTNFARCSNVVVDVCRQHGTWFDRDELRRIVEFIRGGGLEIARAREEAQLEEKRRRLTAAQTASAWQNRTGNSPDRALFWGDGISAAASLLNVFLK